MFPSTARESALSAPFNDRAATDVAAGWAPSEDSERSIAAADSPGDGDVVPAVIADRYQIDRELGRGGMGRVFLAKDLRLKRNVAIKMLPTGACDASKLRRLEHEARLMGSLGHPNVVEIHDIGSFEGRPFLVEEYLEGTTLREFLGQGPVPPPKAIEIVAEIARALGAAHERGVVHCDVKPENLFITKDGSVKVLDFGVARLTPRMNSAKYDSSTRTDSHTFRGTVAYSSPEQLRGEPVDGRSDLFSLGVVVYEMLAGRRPFEGTTAVEVAYGILHANPAALPRGTPPSLQAVVRRCLEKDSRVRFQSAKDLSRELDAISPRARQGRARRWRDVAVAAILVPAIVWIAVAGLRSHRSTPPKSRQVTFLPGAVWTARYAPDGRTVLYTRAFAGPAAQVYSTSIGSPERQRVELEDGVLLGMSAQGIPALLIRPTFGALYFAGTLATVAAAGGAPRELMEGVSFADWSPDGASLAVVRSVGSVQRLEYPIGKSIFQTTGWISDPRISPDGERVAFFDHADFADGAGMLLMATRSGERKVLTGRWADASGLSWEPGGSEIWFTASAVQPPDAPIALRAVAM